WSSRHAARFFSALRQSAGGLETTLGVRFDNRLCAASGLCTDGIALRTCCRRVGELWRPAGHHRSPGHVDRNTPIYGSTRRATWGRPSRRHTMSSGRRLLILGGIALALWGMGYGFWYAV